MEVFAFPFVLSGVYGRCAYESFRQLPVRYKLLKSFRVRFGSLPQLLSPYQWLKERGIYKRIALFCIMCKYIYTARFALWRNDVSGWRTGRWRNDRSPFPVRLYLSFRKLANKRKWTENESLLIDRFGGIVCLLALHLSRIEYSKLINGPTAAASGALKVRIHW